MKFFKRDLLEKDRKSDQENRRQKWNALCDVYEKHLLSIKSLLPQSVQSFSGITLHDSIIKSVSRPHSSELVLEIDGSGCCWGPIGQFTLRFKGVKEVQFDGNVIGDDWMYEEIHLPEIGAFEYRILFSRSELGVIADELEFTIKEGGNKQRKDLLKKYLDEKRKT
ncbi:MAG: DUF4085 family protein [Chlamydiae bacterium]|nr:DUF4085 family protein [Chlamydiota bacterium]MBI3266819.1 DUF4085 family protein [Chlamydiota bacterium]